MRFDSPEFLGEACGHDHGLKVRIETHRLYDIDRRNIFELITTEAAKRLRPQRVLDVGAGTGNWYHTLRRILVSSRSGRRAGAILPRPQLRLGRHALRALPRA